MGDAKRSRTVCNISALPPEVRDMVAAALSGQTCVMLEQIELSQALAAVAWPCCEMLGNVSDRRSFLPMPQVRQHRLLQTSAPSNRSRRAIGPAGLMRPPISLTVESRFLCCRTR